MLRIWHSLFYGAVILVAVEIFWRISPHTPLPGILDFLIAPGFFPMVLFYPCGSPPEVILASNQYWMKIGYLINFSLYVLLIRGIFWWRDRRSLRLP